MVQNGKRFSLESDILTPEPTLCISEKTSSQEPGRENITPSNSDMVETPL